MGRGCAERRVRGISWAALPLEAGESPTAVRWRRQLHTVVLSLEPGLGVRMSPTHSSLCLPSTEAYPPRSLTQAPEPLQSVSQSVTTVHHNPGREHICDMAHGPHSMILLSRVSGYGRYRWTKV